MLGLLVRVNVRTCSDCRVLLSHVSNAGGDFNAKTQAGLHRPSSAGSIRLITSPFSPLLLAVYFFYWAQLTGTDGYGLENDFRGRGTEKQAQPSLPVSCPLLPLHSLPSTILHFDMTAVFLGLSALFAPPLPPFVDFFKCFSMNSLSLFPSLDSASHVLLKEAAGGVKEEEKEGGRGNHQSCDRGNMRTCI